MKKTFLSSVIVGVILFTGFSLSAQNTVAPSAGTYVADKLLMYIPNRLIEITDIFSLDLATGTTLQTGVRLTYAFGFGFDIGDYGKISWEYNRKYGTSLNTSWQYYFMSTGKGEQYRSCPIGNLPEYDYSYSGFRFRTQEKVFVDGVKDYWAIEVKAAVLAGVRFALHPVKLAELVCGFFFYDLSGNDLTLLY